MDPFKLRVVITDANIRKLCLQERPTSVENLKEIIKNKFDINYDFSLQFADSDFGGDMVSLTDINELPQDFATIKVVGSPVVSHLPLDLRNVSYSDLSSASTSGDSVADSSHDTISISSSDDLHSLETKLRQGSWPDVFKIPKLGPELELVFEAGNAKFASSQDQLVLGKDLKSQFLDLISNHIWQYKPYPTHLEYIQVAKAILSKYPCLTEKGSASGFDELVNSLKFKMGNMRAKMRKLDCLEMKINSKKRPSPGVSAPKIKKAKRAELNFLPELPRGEDNTSMEIYRDSLISEMQKKNKNMTMVHSRMSLTYAYRRKELVISAPPVKDILERWPGLFLESELSAEFSRLANLQLETTFFSSLDKYTDKLVELFRRRKGASGPKIQSELEMLEDINLKRTAVLRCLPLYFNEHLFYKDCQDISDAEVDGSLSQKILISGEDKKTISIIIDGNVVMEDIDNFPKSVAMFFCLHYCLHLEYAKRNERTMEFIQKVLINLDGKKLSPKVQSLKNKLMI